jgi:hypothetical protein
MAQKGLSQSYATMSAMAKKKQTKKHKFKYTDPVIATASGVSSSAVAMGGDMRAPQSRQSVTGNQRNFSYVGRDMRRVALLALCLVVLELVLYYLLTHTGLGSTLDSLVHS